MCSSTHTVLVIDWEHPRKTALKQWWVQKWQLGQSVSLFLQVVTLGDLRNIFPWLLQHIDTVAYDKLIKNNFSQVFLLSITSSCWVTFWRETAFVKLCLTETQGKRYVLCLYFTIASQGTRGKHAALSPSFVGLFLFYHLLQFLSLPWKMGTLLKGQIPDSCFCLFISILNEFSRHPHWCPCSHFPEILFL